MLIPPERETGKEIIWFGFGPQVTFTLGKIPPKSSTNHDTVSPLYTFRMSPGSLSDTLTLTFFRLMHGLGLRGGTDGKMHPRYSIF